MTSRIAELELALASHYRLERELGRGGMAVVYLAHDLRNRRPVALKVMGEGIATPSGTERFLREIRIASRLQHPHILPLFDSGEAGGLLFYVMPYIDGGSLRHRLLRERPLPLEEACQIARQIAGALAYAHGQGVIHRDIKPENILLSAGVAVVADLGLAKALTGPADAIITSTGIAVGTPAYMSPEQASGESTIDGRSDLYSLGCVLFEMLSGDPPFTGSSARAVVARHLTDPPPSLRSIRPTIPVRLERAVNRALAKLPVDRFATAWQLGEALGNAIEALTESGPPAAERAQKPEAGAARFRGMAPNLGRLVSKTCDRWKQINAFDAFFMANRKARPGRPQLVVIHGDEGEGHDSLVERLLATKIAHLAEQIGGPERAVVAQVRAPWPSDDPLAVRQRDLRIALFREADPRYLGEDLSAAALRTCETLSMAPIVAVQHDLRARQWDLTTSELIEWYVQEFWGNYPVDDSGPQFLIFLKVIYPVSERMAPWRPWLSAGRTRKERIQQHLRSTLSRSEDVCPGLMLAQLESVREEDVVEWFGKNGISLSAHRRQDVLRALFHRETSKRMSDVEMILETIHREFVRDNMAEGLVGISSMRTWSSEGGFS